MARKTECVDWELFRKDVQATWEVQIHISDNIVGICKSKAHKIWHGRPISVQHFLRICNAMHVHPMKYFIE